MMETYLKKWYENSIKENLRPKCPYCGAKLNHYWFYLYDGTQMQNCNACGKKVVKKTKGK